jgi:hypothetical protein
MARFLQVIVSLPTVIFTVLVGVSLLYWCSVVLGALDIDALGGAGGKDTDGSLGESTPEGHDGSAASTEAHPSGLSAVLGAIELRKVPMTVRVSFVSIFSWLVSALGALSLGPTFSRTGPQRVVFDIVLALTALLLGVRLAGFAARPLARVFSSAPAPRKEHLVGRLAEVSTGRLDARFGQVLVRDGGAGLLLDARFDGAPLSRGEQVVITHYDESRNVVSVEPIERVPRVRAVLPEVRDEQLPSSVAGATRRKDSDSG